MINKINILSIKILNSKYKFIFTLFICLIIYYSYNSIYNVNCMGSFFSTQTEDLSNIEESKRELASYLEREIRNLEGRVIENALFEELYSRESRYTRVAESYNSAAMIYEKSIAAKRQLLNDLQYPNNDPRLFASLLEEHKVNAELNEYLSTLKK